MSGAVAVAPGSTGTQDKQYVLINLLKAVAAQLIVLHHLAFYGPMADHARVLAPELFDWLAGDARIAVQVFLVIGGFLAAKSLAPDGFAKKGNPLSAIWRRYIKLAPPFIIATLLAVGASAIASMWMTHDSISRTPSISQLAAHMLLMHSVLGYESVSAGAWYVAIDFQLYVSAALLLWLCRCASGNLIRPSLVPTVITISAISSLFYFNLDAKWDVWAPYFFGSYGLGMLAWWMSDPVRQPRATRLMFSIIAVPTLAALLLDFRTRIAVALCVACVLILVGRVRSSSGALLSLLDWLAKVSYSIFLVHFPVCLIVNAMVTRFMSSEPEPQGLGIAFAWVASVGAGALFFRWVEAPLGRLMISHHIAKSAKFCSGLAQKNATKC